MRTRWGAWALAVTVAVLGFWGVVEAQQVEQPPAEEDLAARIESLEKRVEAAEETLARLLSPVSETGGAIPLHLHRIEERLARLEAQTLRENVGASVSAPARLLESRIRALEMEVSRLRR